MNEEVLTAIFGELEASMGDNFERYMKDAVPDKGIIPFMIDKDRRMLFLSLKELSTVLFGGTTGSGKTSYVRSLLLLSLISLDPEKYKFIIYDSKGCDYTKFNGFMHLKMPVITNDKNAFEMIQQLKIEVDNRIRTRNCSESIVIIIDDYASLVMNIPEVKDALLSLVQVGPGVNIFVWLVTSLPTPKFVTEHLRFNITTRIAMRVVSKQISRLILDENGAETLYEPGEIICKHMKTTHGYGLYFDDITTYKILELLVQGGMVAHDEDKLISQTIDSHIEEEDLEETDELFIQAGRFIIEREKASIGMLQRAFRIGFNRAARIMDQLCDAGVVGLEEGTKPREILMTMEAFEHYVDNSLEESINTLSYSKQNSDSPLLPDDVFDTNTTNSTCEPIQVCTVKRKEEESPQILDSDLFKVFEPRIKPDKTLLIVHNNISIEVKHDSVEIKKDITKNKPPIAISLTIVDHLKIYKPRLFRKGYIEFVIKENKESAENSQFKNSKNCPKIYFSSKEKRIFIEYADKIANHMKIKCVER